MAMIKKSLLTIVVLYAVPAFASDKEPIKKKIHDLCMSRFARTVDTRKAVCDCSVKNLDLKNSKAELEYIYSVLKSKSAQDKMTDEQIMLVEYSTDVSEKCVKDPKWIVNK